MKTVKNQYDIEIDFDLAILIMDKTIQEKVHTSFTAFGWNESTDNRRQLFFFFYCQEHKAAFKIEFEPNKKYPVW